MKSRWDSAEKAIEAEGLVGRKMIVNKDIFSIWAIYNRKDIRNIIYKMDELVEEEEGMIQVM